MNTLESSMHKIAKLKETLNGEIEKNVSSIMIHCYLIHVVNLFEFYQFNCDALWDLVLFIQFKKANKHLWRSATFSKVGDVFDVFLIAEMVPNRAKNHK